MKQTALEAGDLPEPWRLVASPVDATTARALNAFLPKGVLPHSWHDIEAPGLSRARVCIVEAVEADGSEEGAHSSSGRVEAVLVTPDDSVFCGPVTSAVMRDVPVEAINRALRSRWAEGASTMRTAVERAGDLADQPIRPPGRQATDRFYAHVALRYLHHLALSPATPTQALTDEVGGGVPHATVARWVVGARKRRFLPAYTRSTREGH